MSKLISFAAIAGVLVLSACGDTDLERGATGGAIGAVAGAATGTNPVVTGAVGAAAGVLCDDVTPRYCR